MIEANDSRLINALIRFHLSGAYPVLFAILCAFSGLSDKYTYLSIILLLSASVVFCIFFVKDNKVFLVPIILMYYSLGTDNMDTYNSSNGNVIGAFDDDAFICICVIGISLAVLIIARFIIDGTLKYAFTHRGQLFWSIIIIDIAFMINGIFSMYWSSECLKLGAILSFGLTLFYFLIYPIIMRSGVNIIAYTCQIITALSYVVMIQVIVLALNANLQGDLIFFEPYSDRWIINRNYFALSWGITTVIGAVSVLGIPASLYLAKHKRFPLFYYISAILFWLVSCLINTRSAMVAGALLLLIGIFFICFRSKNRRINLIFTSILLLLLVSGTIWLVYYLNISGLLDKYLRDIFRLFRFDEIGARIEIFKEGWKDFQGNLLFGAGLRKGALAQEVAFANFFSNMYHNIVIQFAASSGIAGIIALLFHIKDFFILAFKKINTDRLLLLLAPLGVIAMSLADNFFFYLNIQILYIVFFSLAEKDLKIKSGCGS